LNKKHIFILAVGAPLFAIFLAAVQVYYNLAIWEYKGKEVIFTIKPGEPFSRINYRLKKKHLISNSRIFHHYVSYKQQLTKFKAGEYSIKPNTTMVELLNILLHGKSKTIAVTIPEGKNIFEIGKILERKNIIQYAKFITLAKDRTFTKSLGIPAERVEGYLFPETYHFTKQSPAKIVIKTMVNQLKKKTKHLDFKQGNLTPHQIIILASIVEKETGAGWERPIIAGVFLNRLKKHMRLQSDPTTIYGIFEHFNGNLKKKHLLEKTPYNTYKISGLPKGPICNPGLEAINAVLHPKKHNYLYFVSMNDGTHVFSARYSDHVRAVNKYQKSRKYRQGRSWRDLHKRKHQ
jgi:UPF0755 protein